MKREDLMQALKEEAARRGDTQLVVPDVLSPAERERRIEELLAIARRRRDEQQGGEADA
jgi:ethanolamine ammonia-lyase small subunit